ncbi:MAG TPA: hypothetical protein VJV79_03940 [Polyangiaceae bacterium]|nr:hypothetical protein [Polyangiaceae bacterium]
MKSRIYSVAKAAGFGWGLPSPRALRLSAYVSLVASAGLLLIARGLYAATREDAFGIGHELLGLSDLTGGAEVVLLNGQRFHHAVSASAQPLSTVLDRIEAHCRQHPGPAALLLDQLAAREPERFERHAPPGALRSAVFREQVAEHGMVLCFVGGPSPASADGWLRALRRFSSSRDLSEFGRLRYSFAERAEEGRTRVVTLWADTGLNLSNLFPQTGDAPGSDSPVLPRPPNARRTLSANAEGLPFGVRLYESSQSLAATQEFYDVWMSEHGYQAAHDAESGTSSYLRADGYQAFLSLFAGEGHSYVTLTESGQSDASATLQLGGQP